MNSTTPHFYFPISAKPSPLGANGASFLSRGALLAFSIFPHATRARVRNTTLAACEKVETIPGCPRCQGNGCRVCLGTGLTEEDCDLGGLARAGAQFEPKLEVDQACHDAVIALSMTLCHSPE